MKFLASPNFGDRRGVAAPSMIILHYTGMQSAEAALARLCDPAAQVSAHYLVDEDGAVVQMVEEDKRAWHAGAAHWAGESDVNAASIGIEIVNPGHEFGYRAFPAEQMDAVLALCTDVVNRNNVANHMVLGHSDVAPGRKIDPGELFDWRFLADHGIGLMPNDGPVVEFDDPLKALTAFGYDSNVDISIIVAEFHRHYLPQRLGKDWNEESARALGSLLYQKQNLRA